MKLKYPKEIRIGSCDYNVKYDNSYCGGKWSFEDGFGYIEIGTMGGIELQIFENILHEIKEIIQTEQFTRIKQGTKEIYLYDHEQHQDFCCRLAGILDYFIV